MTQLLDIPQTGSKAPSYRDVYSALRQEAESAGPEGHPIPSYSELSQRFDVSVSTVVKAINILKNEGYVYGQQGRATYIRQLPKSTTQAQLAFITPALGNDMNLYVKGLSENIDPTRYTIATYSTHSDLEKYQNMINQVAMLNPAGVILTTLPETLCQIDPEPLIRANIPIVTIGPPVDGLTCDRVFQTGQDSGKKLIAHLLGKQCDDFALLMVEPADDPHRVGLLESIRKELAAAGKQLSDDNIFVIDAPHGYMPPADPYIDAQNAVEEILSRQTSFKTLICCHDYPAVGALRAMLSSGLRVPEDMMLASATRCSVEGVTPINLTTIDCQREEQAQIAADIIQRRIDGFDGPPETHYVTGRLIFGQTT